MATTTYGTPYVQSSDLVSGYPSTSSSLADRLDAVAYSGNGLNAQTGTTYTLVLTDAGKTITLSNAAAVTLTVPTNASVAFPTNTVVTVVNRGAGTVTISGAGVTFQPSGNITLATDEVAVLQKVATDTWQRIDGLAAKAATAGPTFTGTVVLPATTQIGGGTNLGAWTAYTPTLTGFTLGNGTVAGRYVRIGNIIHFRVNLVFGSTTAAAVNVPTFTVPVTAQGSYLAWSHLTAVFYDQSAATAYIAGPRFTGTTTVAAYLMNSVNGLWTTATTTAPFTWAVNDEVQISGTYEAA